MRGMLATSGALAVILGLAIQSRLSRTVLAGAWLSCRSGMRVAGADTEELT